MNLMHLKYAVEIAKTGSLSKAAENLFMGQPNLSRAIKELEATLGITIFERTSKGMTVTSQGAEFLRYANKALKEIEEIENLYKSGAHEKNEFSISVPRATYISYAFAEFSKQIEGSHIELYYKETNAARVVSNILEKDYNLGIIRYATSHDYYFKQMLEEKGLGYEMITEFSYKLIMSENHPLAKKDEIYFEELIPYTEIAYPDLFVPTIPTSELKKEEFFPKIEKRIFVFERASRFELLSINSNTFMWGTSLPEETLKRYFLVQKKCADNVRIYKDMLIYKKNYRLSKLDRAFITELCASKRKYIG